MQTPRYPTLRDYLFVVRANWLVILVVAVIGGAVAFAVAERKPISYEATALMAFDDETRQLALLGFPVSAQAAPDQLPATRAQAVTNIDVADRVRTSLGLEATPLELAGKISASVTEEGLVTVTASDDDAVTAVALANAFAKEDRDKVNANARERFAEATDQVRDRIRGLGRRPEEVALRGALTEQLARLQFLRSAAAPASIVGQARQATRLGGKPLRDGAIGLLLGLILGIVGAFVRDALDRRLRGTPDIESRLALPLLGRVRAKGLGTPVAPPDAAVAKLAPDVEAYRIIRQNLDFLATERLTVVAVTSAVGGEGKSTVSASLAAAAAAAGRRTLLVECDLRRPSVGARFDVAAAPGLTDLLSGAIGRDEAVQPLRPKPSGGRLRKSPPRHWPEDVSCITAGTPTEQPAELLGSGRFAALLADLSRTHDLVVLDTSPLLPVADTLELLPLVDGIVLCVRSGSTTLEQAMAAKGALAHYPDRPTGLVVTGLRARDEQGYGTYYSSLKPAKVA